MQATVHVSSSTSVCFRVISSTENCSLSKLTGTVAGVKEMESLPLASFILVKRQVGYTQYSLSETPYKRQLVICAKCYYTTIRDAS